ncbi:MAG: hypothetical protein ACXVAT_18590 [Isosphaeraceae bacterium]
MLDRTKVPPDLVVHRVWTPEGTAAGRVRPVAYATERRRRLMGGLLVGLGLVMLVVLFLVQAPSYLAILGVAISVAGGWYALGGESGFYEVREDGGLGEFLGRTKPDLGSMRGVKVP